jgi:hypothetical protein
MVGVIGALSASLWLGVASAADVGVFHLPLVEASAGNPVHVAISSTDLVALGQVELFYRQAGDENWHSLGFGQRQDGDWAATIPSNRVLSGALEYRIVSSVDGGAQVERFASASDPQRIDVKGNSTESKYMRELARYGGHTSRARVHYRRDDFGTNDTMEDNMWGVTTDLTFRVLGNLRALRFGVSRMRAETVSNGNSIESIDGSGTLGEPTSAISTGYDSGFAELQFGVSDTFGLSTQVQLGANLESFTAGYRVAARLGMEPGTHVELYGESVGGIGFVAGMGLHWDTVPHLPMSTAIEVTNWPNADQVALRLLTEAQIPVTKAIDLTVQGTYQARTQVLGGFGGGVGCAFSF